MANSRIGNYQLQFVISGLTAPTRSHFHSVYVLPLTTPTAGTPVADIDIQLKGGGSDDLQSVANLYCSFLRNLYPSAFNVTNFTLWRYATENVKDFITGGIAVPTTAGSGTHTIAWQSTFTYRTAGGSILKQVFLESTIAGNAYQSLVANASGNIIQRMVAYVLSASSPVIGIDNTFAITPLREANGENEKLQKKIYRS